MKTCKHIIVDCNNTTVYATINGKNKKISCGSNLLQSVIDCTIEELKNILNCRIYVKYI